MRRHSFVGPLVLILIGALFLIQNLHPEWISFELISTYWPFLLIAWGVLRLIEVCYYHFSSRRIEWKGVSGGEWALIVFICVIGSAMFFFHRHAADFPRVFMGNRSVEIFGEVYDYPIQEVRTATKVPKILVDNPRGNTRIVGADTAEVKIGGRKSIRAYGKSVADEADRQTRVKVTTEGDQLVIRAAQEQSSGNNLRVSTDLELTVPRGVSIQATGRQGDFDILTLNGGVDIVSNNAGVRLQDIAGSARVDLRKSDIVRAVNVTGNVDIMGRGQDVELDNVGGTVTINGSYSGELRGRNLAKPLVFQSGTTELRVARAPGQFNLTLGDLTGKDMVGPIRLTSRSRDVRLESFQGAVEVSVERGDVTLESQGAPSDKIDAKTGSGNIELALPSGASFEISATTRRGEADNQFGGSLQQSSDGQGAFVKGATGRGPRITLTTDRGKISLRKQ